MTLNKNSNNKNKNPRRKNARKKTRRKAKPPTINDLPPELRGPPQNKYGGYQTTNIRPFPNNTFGPAGPPKRLGEAVKEKWAIENKEYLEKISKKN